MAVWRLLESRRSRFPSDSANFATFPSHPSGGLLCALAVGSKRACRTLGTDTPSAAANRSWLIPFKRSSVASRNVIAILYALRLTTTCNVLHTAYTFKADRYEPVRFVEADRRSIPRNAGTHRVGQRRYLPALWSR